MLQARLYGISRSDARRRALELLEMVGLSDAANRIVRSYSGGMRRRLELAMGLINNPELLILDEPTLGLDVQSRLALWDYIRMLKKENGLTIIITTHYMDEADKLSDMVAIIDHGRIVVEGSPEELKSRIGGDVIMVKISRASQEIIDRIRVVDDVLNVDLVENIIRIKVRSAEKAMARLLGTLSSINADVESISITKPTLDQVFVEYTGRVFREEEPGDFRKQVMVWRRRR
jgi:ABC-2 type transport system ATP-binding protein